MNKRRPRQGSAPVNKDSFADSSRDSESAPLVGLEPTDPPRKNKLLLMLSGVCFLVWFGFLVWLMVNG